MGGGAMVSALRAIDWSTNPLGPMASWPQSLRTTLNLVQASTSPIALVWGPGHVQLYNDGYWPICGSKHPVSMGQDFRECWASAFPVIGEAYATAWSGKSAYLENERMFLDRYGFLEETWFTFSFSPITDESGAVGGLFHPVTEMTREMLAERRTRTLRDLALRACKARTTEEAFAFSAEALAAAPFDVPFVMFYSVSSDARHARLVGQSGVEPGTWMSPESVDLAIAGSLPWSLGEVVRTGVPQQIDGADEWLLAMSVGPYPEIPSIVLALPILQPGTERPTAVMIAGVSARLAMDDSYRGFYDLLATAVGVALANARAYEDERKKVEELAALHRAKSEFFSNVSHEFRTPLTLLLGPLEDELAERDAPLPQDRRERLETAHRNAVRLLKLVNTLLDFSRIEAGRIEAAYEPTDLAAYTAELASVFRAATEKAGLLLNVECAPLPELVYVDRAMWEKVVLNLLSNAIKHTFHGSIGVKLEWGEGGAVLSVSDTGVGIPAAELPRVFERFHRVKGAKSRTHEGTGIGLSLVEELVRLHGGTVSVESNENVGSTFRVTVKAGRTHLLQAPQEPGKLSGSSAMRGAAYVEEALRWSDGASGATSPASVYPAVPSNSAFAGTRRARVLWVDDNADMREYVRRLLTVRYDVLAFGDGDAALAAARAEPPDLVLADVMMPGLDGIGLLRELRLDPTTRTIPVILLSARAGEDAIVEGLETGADDYVCKPFAARELLARVRTHLELAHARKEWTSKLERTNRELEEFVYVASHDLQEPLRMVRSYVQLLGKEYTGKLDADADRYIHYAVDGAARMQGLINDMLALSRLDSDAKAMAMTDAGAALAGALDDLQLVIRESGAVITSDALPTVMADAVQLGLVFQNLIGNAIKFHTPGEAARVHVSARHDGTAWVFSVRDDGIGIAMKHGARVFRMFQRLHTRHEYPGTGIGLSIAKRAVERAGGRIWFESEPGKGATFHFTSLATRTPHS